MVDTPYAGTGRSGIPSAAQLRARIPGWGADLDPANRPAVPREVDGRLSGTPGEPPVQQIEHRRRERSVEHARLPAVFGTSVPLRGLSGVVRRAAYARFSEARAAHWLLLLLADRVDVVEQSVAAAARGRPDNPLTETGVRAELSHHGWRSRVGHSRADVRHHIVDPVIVVGPWAVALWVAARWLGGRRHGTRR